MLEDDRCVNYNNFYGKMSIIGIIIYVHKMTLHFMILLDCRCVFTIIIQSEKYNND